MGSGVSSSGKQIEEINQPNNNLPEDRDDVYGSSSQANNANKRGGSGQRRKAATKVCPISDQETVETNDTKLSTEQQQLEESRLKLQDLEGQMSALESQNLELQDQIFSLEHQLSLMESVNSTKSQTNEDFSETLLAKDQHIERLEKELQTVQNELSKMRRKFKKKLRLLSTQLSEAKQGQSVHAFELQDKLQRLTEEKERLMDQVKERSPPLDSEGATGGNSTLQADGRMQIILELSAKVSEQDAKISQLERELRQRDLLERAASQAAMSRENSGLALATRGGGTSTKLDGSHGDISVEESISQGDDDIKAVMQQIRKEQRGKKKNEHFRSLSGISRDSGIENAKSTNLVTETVTQQDESDWGDSESDDDAMSSKPSSAISRSSVGSGLDSAQMANLDPASIRRISAAKLRKAKNKNDHTRTSTDNTFLSGKPPVPVRMLDGLLMPQWAG